MNMMISYQELVRTFPIAYTAGTPSFMRYKAAYVKTANGVTDGAVKGVATFTITY
ncbi:hypothetical protein [Klebsiella quasipneumoniae]|uniref:hypothetical protein n=1 Tax=Klebsiella quasipneumoniae TaxID=1463165 RepID=UPI003FA57EDF